MPPGRAVWLISHVFKRIRELKKALSHEPLTRSHRAVLCSGILEELYQLLVEQSGHRRRLHLRKCAE